MGCCASSKQNLQVKNKGEPYRQNTDKITGQNSGTTTNTAPPPQQIQPAVKPAKPANQSNVSNDDDIPFKLPPVTNYVGKKQEKTTA